MHLPWNGVVSVTGGGAASLRVLAVVACLAVTALRAQEGTPPNLVTWADLDGVASSAFSAFSNEAMLYPPGFYHFAIGQGYCTFADDGDVAAVTNLCSYSMQYGVPVWQLSVTETQTTQRVWLFIGADGTAFRTNPCPSGYDPQQWVRDAYQYDSPSYLTGSDLDQWYADRDRSRYSPSFMLVNANDWPTLQAAAEAAATNAPGSGAPPPTIPADTNNLSIANVLSSPSSMDLWIFTPAARPVAVLASTNLVLKGWAPLGSFAAVPPFNLWHAPLGFDALFVMPGFVDVDSDGDGIPDFIELYVTRTDRYKWDSAGTSLGDFARMFIYGLSLTNRDSNADGMDDDEAILGGLNPNAWNTGADAGSIRYYYDADDRVAGAFSGSPAGAVRYRVSPAGNHTSTAERSAP